MNLWIRNGAVPETSGSPCRIARLPAEGLARPVMDATQDDYASAMARLAAVSASGGAFALASDDPAVVLAAAAMGAEDIVVGEAAILDLPALARIVAARGDDANPPAENERCLTVRRALRPGDIIVEGDLDVAPTEYRGLGPAMGGHVIGLRLRYAVSPGEALHFGHFHDRHADQR